MMTKLLLGYSTWGVNLVAENEEGHLCKLLNGKQSVELGLALGEAFKIGRINKVDNAIYFGEVVSPEAAGLRVSS